MIKSLKNESKYFENNYFSKKKTHLIFFQFLIVLFALVGISFASTLIPAALTYRAPEFDSAIIRSDRLGGNFAYSTVEGHAFKSIAPVVQDVRVLTF